jgi:hypothetical protein
MKFKELNALATELVGDSKKPNLFFVCDAKGDVQMVTSDFNAAYSFWNNLPNCSERTLEDRRWGVICSTEPEREGSTRFVTHDDSDTFCKRFRIKRQ